MKTYIGADALALLKEKFSSVEYSAEEAKPAVYVPADELLQLLSFLRDEMGFTRIFRDGLSSVCVEDFGHMSGCS